MTVDCRGPGRVALGWGLALWACLPVVSPTQAAARQSETTGGEPVVVASKPFAESLILGEMFAQVLEARGIPVDRRPGLGATEIAFRALREDAVDVYPEYTGTGLLVILGEEGGGSAASVYARVSRAFLDRWGVRWLAPLGFQNTYAVAMRRGRADSLGIRSLSALAEASPGLVGGFTPDFMGRADGLRGLTEVYGMDFAAVRPLVQAVKYRALAEGGVDVIDGYATDGALDRYDLVVLEDDMGFFPPYEAAPLVSRRLAETRPAALAALSELAGRLDETDMRRANRMAEVDGVPVERIAETVLRELGVSAADDGRGGPGRAASAAGTEAGNSPDRRQGLWAFLSESRGQMAVLVGEHLLLVGISLLGALLVAIPLGMALAGSGSLAEPTVRAVGVLQTIPSIALLAFMIPILGIGVAPAVAALFLYSLLPVLRNTVSGIREADPEAAEAGRALGMTPRQVLLRIRLPLAAPIIMAGVRTAAVINVGTATLAAFIGAGGLGEPIVAGLALSDNRLILAGAIPAALLAVLVDAVLSVVEGGVAPRGLKDAH